MNRLLYLEDDEALALVSKRALEKRGFSVTHIHCLSDFFAHAENNSLADITHALLDLRLDDGNSLSIISELMEANPAIKIVILTGYSSIATTVQAIKMGACNYLAKPATIEQIISAFDSVTSDNLSIQEQEESKTSLKRLEWEHIQRVLAENKGNISATARELNMHRRTLQRKLNKKPALW